ncbi:MAG TPA: hypothetical protein VEF76_07900 [Patescibacteria group bacterium]|nr:hypothetical protein [Patescibacteria group bacterium]
MEDYYRKVGKSLTELFNETARELTAALAPDRERFFNEDRPLAAAAPRRRREPGDSDADVQEKPRRRALQPETEVSSGDGPPQGILKTSFAVTAQVVKAVVEIVKAGTRQKTKAPLTARFKKGQSNG